MASEIRQLSIDDLDLMHALLDCFGDVFDDPEHYCQNRPSLDYFRRLLGQDTLIALVASENNGVVGGLAAYELQKFEQERSEIYIYDLAVREPHRRTGVATALIDELRSIARERGAYVIFVQADTGIEDEPAIALYSKLGTKEEVLHFDIEP